jgi:TPP-dependent pyruvate/acetoin dehydrogenase alpha subunit
MGQESLLIDAYKKAYLIRKTEEVIIEKYSEQEMRCPTHLSIGQEMGAVGVCAALSKEDRVFSNHRCHAHYLAKGGDLVGLISELYGKAEGCAGGYGGSMHLVDESVGMMGTSAIVGSSVSIALGSALSLRGQESDSIVVAYIGDATRETGQLYESMNMAALWQLPIMFVCEDNKYATSTPLWQRQPKREFSHVASAIGMNAYKTEDDEFETIYAAASRGRENLPVYLEFPTYRFRAHVGMSEDTDLGYRTKEEVEAAIELDPLAILRGKLSEKAVRAIHYDVDCEVEDAFAIAKAAPWPARL